MKDAPALIEQLLPVQKLSAEIYKERMAGTSQALTALGNFWKGRKPLILNKACIIGCLLPASDNPKRDLEIFEKIMAMDDESFVVRWKRRPKPKEILERLSIAAVLDFFVIEPEGIIKESSPIDWTDEDFKDLKVYWRKDLNEMYRRMLEAQMLPQVSYRERVDSANRPEEVGDSIHDHIWDSVNDHLGTDAYSFPDLIEQLGLMRFGHRTRVADTFCGSGQIPFEAARLGCDVYASDLNPVASMLTWGALNIIGKSQSNIERVNFENQELIYKVQKEINDLGIECDGNGWQTRNFIYCVETKCPQTGWMVPLIPSLVISMDYGVVAELIPNNNQKRYDIKIRYGATSKEMKLADQGTLRSDGRGQDAYLYHQVNGKEYKTKIKSLRGDFRKADGSIGNRLRLWEKNDFKPRPDDLLQERLYAILWMRPKSRKKGYHYELRAVTPEDIERERTVEGFIETHLADWQSNGFLPDMRIEVGGPPRYQGLDLIKARGWTYWHHLFNPRQLLLEGLIRKNINVHSIFGFCQTLNYNSKLSIWLGRKTRGYGNTVQTFNNQALNTIYNYGCRASSGVFDFFNGKYKNYPFREDLSLKVKSDQVINLNEKNDIYITDPPYGNAVKYEEILDFFIAWLRKSPPAEFSKWVWDSRRSLAIQGEGEDFRREMVNAYKRMSEWMPDNGIQIIMFTHQSGAIWGDMANIVWASGLQVSAAWYVVTETDSVLREGSYVKGTVLLVCRKRLGTQKTTRDDLAWEIQDEVEDQINYLTGLNQNAKGLYRDENVFEDSDIQMAGYAAALRVLTRYAIIDGRDMTAEAIRPRIKGETTFVDGLIAFAVDTANQCLVPKGIPKSHWDKLSSAERFYLKMIDLEAKGAKTLDNYQNFAKAFKVRDFQVFMASKRANNARLKSAAEFGRTEMGEGSELHESVLRAVIYAIMELVKDMDSNEVLAHLTMNIPNYYGDMTQRDLAVELADYLAKRLEELRPEEASAARVLRERVKNQRLG